MPNAVVKSYAQKSGKSVSAVEKLWDKIKSGADKKFKKDDPHYWSYVSGTVKKILGLTESTTFKEFVQLSFDNPEPELAQPEAVELEVRKPCDYGIFISCIFAARDKAHELHLASKSYSQHIALNELYDLLVDFADELTESYQGKHGLIKVGIPTADVVFDQPCACTFIQYFVIWLEGTGRSLIGNDSFIVNLFEEMLGEIYRVKYKLDNLS